MQKIGGAIMISKNRQEKKFSFCFRFCPKGHRSCDLQSTYVCCSRNTRGDRAPIKVVKSRAKANLWPKI